MNTEIQHNKAAAVEQHMLAILNIAHAEDTTDSMRRWIADQLRELPGDISTSPPVPRETFIMRTAYAHRVAYHQASQATALRAGIETGAREIASTALPNKPLDHPSAARPADLSDEEYESYESYALRHAAHIRQYSGQPFVPVRRKSVRIDWRYPTGRSRTD